MKNYKKAGCYSDGGLVHAPGTYDPNKKDARLEQPAPPLPYWMGEFNKGKDLKEGIARSKRKDK